MLEIKIIKCQIPPYEWLIEGKKGPILISSAKPVLLLLPLENGRSSWWDQPLSTNGIKYCLLAVKDYLQLVFMEQQL